MLEVEFKLSVQSSSMADYSWVALIAISAICWTISISLQRLVLKEKTSVIGYNALYGIIASLFFVPFIFTTKLPAQPEAWIFFVITIGIWVIAGLLQRLQFRHSDIPLQVGVATSEMAFAFILGIILLAESITPMKIFGLLVVAAGIIISGFGEANRKLLMKVISIILVASFFSALANVADKYTIQFFDPFFFGFFLFFFPGVIPLIFIKKESLKKTEELILKKKWLVAGAALSSAIAYLAVLMAYKIPTTEISTIYPVFEVLMLLAIPVSTIITGEKQNLFWKTIGAIVATAGAILILGI